MMKCRMCGKPGGLVELGVAGRHPRVLWLCRPCKRDTQWWLINNAVTPAEARTMAPERCNGLDDEQIAMMMMQDHAEYVADLPGASLEQATAWIEALASERDSLNEGQEPAR